MDNAGWQGLLLAAMIVTALPGRAHAPVAPQAAAASEGYREMEWRAPQVSRVLTQGWVDTLGISFVWPRPEQAEVREIEGRRCLVGGFFSFDVDDGFAFDVDETIELEMELETGTTAALLIDHDHNGRTLPPRTVALMQQGARWQTQVIKLERARFANLGQYGTDIAIAASGAAVPADPQLAFDPANPHQLTICSLHLRRSHTTPKPAANGWLEIRVQDENGELTPARLGLYDASGRIPLPGEDAVPMQRYGDRARLVRLRFSGEGRTDRWFNDNRWVFFTRGSYRARVPAGKYELVVAKGPEYHVARRPVEVIPDATGKVAVRLRRWTDMTAQGWISGDDHAHLVRKVQDNEDILAIAQAEDVKVLNLLRMGNLSGVTFEQYAYGDAGVAHRDGHYLVSGQEDPRSGQRGHTLHLNIREPVRSVDYFAYHEVFERMRAQGAVSGYAHFGEGHFNERRGVALDAPFDLVDIAEVLQFGALNLSTWYEFLNLGFKITPSGGADWPYGNLPGTERSYVHTGPSAGLGAWYRMLKSGNTFVSNGPMLEFSVNGLPPGSELQLGSGEQLSITARARQNPDYDSLDRLELVVNGDVVASVRAGSGRSEELRLEHEIRPGHGMWVAVRAYGRDYAKAHSAPVYVVVDGDPSWRREDVPALAASMRRAVRELLEQPPNALLDLEYWDTHQSFELEWKRQLPKLEARVEAAERFYQELAERAGAPRE